MVSFKFNLNIFGKYKETIADEIAKCADVIMVAAEDNDFSEVMKAGFDVEFNVDGIASEKHWDKVIKDAEKLLSSQKHTLQAL